MVSSLGAERRQHARVRRAQFYLRVAGHIYHTVEWSYGGFLIEDKVGRLSPGALLWIDGLITEEDYRRCKSPVPVEIRARVLRVDRDLHMVAVTCLKLDDAAYAMLSEIVNGPAVSAASPAE